MDRIDDEDEKPFSFIVKLFYENKVVSVLVCSGLLMMIIGIITLVSTESVTELGIVTDEGIRNSITVEVSGAVISPGVFTMDHGSRVIDLITFADGLSDNADHEWIGKYLNNAKVLEDGEKIYIPTINEQSDVLSASDSTGDQTISVGNYAENESLVNINTSSASRLESLWGIGRVTAQNIIDQRPYSKIEDLVERKILKENVYERNKHLLTVY